ncbi:MAG: glycosyltransferase family A protein [Planctomycetota bacterium]
MDEPRESNESPPVTVVMPTYNQEKYVEDAVTSIQAQNYKGPIRILLWNDGSTDRTLEIIQRLQQNDDRIVVHSAENQGRPLARQSLIEAAETELIAWLDPDDFASPNWLREQVCRMLEDDTVMACGGQGYAMLQDRDPVAPIPRPLTHDEIHAEHLEGGVAIFQTGVVAKRSAMLDAGGYRARYTVGEDFDLWLRLAEQGKLVNVSGCHTYYRLHEASANWSAGTEERALWYEILNQAREREGFPPREAPSPLPVKKDDWNRRIFWINLAAREGNARSCLKLVIEGLRRHPASLLFWLFGVVAILDSIRFLGNRIKRFEPGQAMQPLEQPTVSFYQLARALNRLRRKIVR